MIRLAINLAIILCASQLWAAKCGFDVLMQHQREVKQGTARMLAKQGTCTADDLIDPSAVRVDTTAHFRIIYTLKGPHAVIGSDTLTRARPPYIDTLMQALEHAYKLHTDTIGMRVPRGPTQSYHYQISAYPEKFAVEVIDIDLLRNISSVLGSICAGCYGLTLPDANDQSLTSLFVDNDFRYQTSTDPLTTVATADGKTCTYTQSNRKLIGEANGQPIDYTVDWNKAIHVTATHELYHTCQLRYANYNDNYHFWFEASAVGVEDLGAPTVNDYFQYLPQIFSHPEISMLDFTQGGGMRPYGQGVFYHYQVHRFGKRFDPGTWELLEKHPLRSIDSIFNDHFIAQGIAGGFPEVFADHALHLAYANSRSKLIPADSIWDADLASWPAMSLSDFSLDSAPTAPFSFRLYPSNMKLTYWSLPSGYRKTDFTLGDSVFTLLSVGFVADSSTGSVVPKIAQAYPIPWRGSGSLFFHLTITGPIEIFDMGRNKIAEVPYTGNPIRSWDGSVKGKLIAPGVYYWHGKSEKQLHRFLVIR